MKLSIFIVTANRLKQLKSCCYSVAAALPQGSEVIVVVNGHQKESIKWLRNFDHPAFQWRLIPKTHRAQARNLAFEFCRGELVYFLDDDVIVPPHLFLEAIHRFEKDPHLAILGGPNLTPPKSPWKEKLFGAILTSPFAAPKVSARYGSALKRGAYLAKPEDLILCNLVVRNTLLPHDVRFRKNMQSNEENLFLFECQNRRLKLIHHPLLFVYHFRRKSLRLFLQQIFSYGQGRGQQTATMPASSGWLFWVPALSTVLFPILLLFPSTRIVVAGGLILHTTLSSIAAFSSREIRKLELRGLLLSGPLTLGIHFAFGLGFLSGWLRSVFQMVRQIQPPEIKPVQRFSTP